MFPCLCLNLCCPADLHGREQGGSLRVGPGASVVATCFMNQQGRRLSHKARHMQLTDRGVSSLPPGLRLAMLSSLQPPLCLLAGSRPPRQCCQQRVQRGHH